MRSRGGPAGAEGAVVMKIAVIGTGISGNLVARMLHAEHDVHVFEANGYIGGHANTVDFRAGGPGGVRRHGIHGVQSSHLSEFRANVAVDRRCLAAE